MAFFNWDDRYSVGVKNIDSQHQTLFAIVNELHTAMLQGKAKNIAEPLLIKLIQYTQEHFSAEEKLLASVQYPQLPGHHLLHTGLTQQVEDFLVRFQSGERALNINLLNFLQDWLTKHILSEDKKYGPWLNQHGIL